MMPLYAARVQDLGPGDVAEFKCGAHRGAASERPTTRAWAETERPDTRPGTAVAMPALRRERGGCRVDLVEGGTTLQPALLSAQGGGLFAGNGRHDAIRHII